MPLQRRVIQTAADVMPLPFVDVGDKRAPVRVPAASLTVDIVDAQGYLKAGVPLTRAGALPGIAPAFVYGCVVEPTKVAAGNAAADLAAAADFTVGVSLDAVVNRAALEDNLGRALTADEAAAFDRAGSTCQLVP